MSYGLRPMPSPRAAGPGLLRLRPAGDSAKMAAMFLFRATLFLPAALAAAAPAGEAAPPFPNDRRPAAPVYSQDGRIVVHAPRFRAAYRPPVLLFCDRARQELARASGLAFEPENGILEVAIGSRPARDARVLTSRFRDRATGAVKERIELPDPENADLALFRLAVCKAFLRLWVADAAPGPERPPAPLPAWLGDGLCRYAARGHRQADLDRVLLLWSNASLPLAEALFSEGSEAARKEPAVAAVLAGWMLDRRRGSSLLERCLRRAAAGERWDPGQAALFFTGAADPAAFDLCIDRKLLAARRTVSAPGATTDGILRRFRSSLLLYAPGSDKLTDSFSRGTGFREAILHAQEPAFRAAALRQAGRMRVAAVGRDGTLMEIAKAYERFLLAFASGKKKPGELMRLLAAAEALRREAERRTARGEVLREPVKP